MGALNEFAKKNSKYIKLKDGESFSGKFLGYKFGEDMNGNETVIYNFKEGEGNEKKLQSSGQTLASFFDEVDGPGHPEGVYKITRSGEGRETRYRVSADKDLII